MSAAGLPESGVFELPPEAAARVHRGSGAGLGGAVLAPREPAPVIVLVAALGSVEGARAEAAALACAASEPDRAALLADLGEGRALRPSLLATAAARDLEERLAAHLPAAPVASRGAICHLAPGSGEDGIEVLPRALPLARPAAAVVHLPAAQLQTALASPRVGATAVMLVARLRRERALAALAAADAVARGLRVAVLKRPLGWLAARRALFGALPPGAALPPRLVRRLLGESAPEAGEGWSA